MKKLFCIFVSVFTIFSSIVPITYAYAEDPYSNASVESFTWIIPLDDDYYENTICDKKGIPATLTVSSIPSIARVANGSKLISYSSATINMSFIINVSGNRITNAYDAKYTSSYNIVDATLSYSSNEATLKVKTTYLLSQNTYSLTASIKSGQLFTSFN